VQAGLLALERSGDDVVQRNAIVMRTKQRFTMIAAQDHVIERARCV